MAQEFRTNYFSVSLLVVLSISSKINLAVCSDQETNLINDLMRDYQKYSRPVSDPNLPLHLNITLTLKQIIDLDERNQLLKTNLWLEYYWFDDKMKWKTVCKISNDNNDKILLNSSLIMNFNHMTQVSNSKFIPII